MSPVPLLLCGKSAALATTFSTSLETLNKDYKIVHVCHDLATAKREVPALLRGEAMKPASGMGMNGDEGAAVVVPKAIVLGKGFSDDEVHELKETCKGERTVAWLVPDDKKMTWTRIAKVAATAGTGLPVVIAQRVIDCLQEHGMVPGKEDSVEGVGELWGF